MAYESSLDYRFSPDLRINDLESLNKEISELNYGMSEAVIKESHCGIVKEYALEMNDFSGRFDDDEAFADLLKKHITQGKAEIYYTGEDGAKWGYAITPGKYEPLEFIAVPQRIAGRVKEYIRTLL